MVFRDQRRAGAGGVRFWAECGWDVVRSAPPLRVESWQSRWQMDNQLTEGAAMRKTMAVLSIVIGAIETLNALVEFRAASAVGLDTTALVIVTLGVLVGVLLIASGIVLASRSPKSQVLPLVAAIACLAVFALIPRMSIFSKMLGIGFPIALLLFLRFGRGQPTRTVA